MPPLVLQFASEEVLGEEGRGRRKGRGRKGMRMGRKGGGELGENW